MATHRRTEIRIETEQVLIIRRHRSVRVWCLECGCEVDALNSRDAEIIAGISQQATPDSRVAKWHLPISLAGSTLVCLESLLKSMQSGNPKPSRTAPENPLDDCAKTM